MSTIPDAVADSMLVKCGRRCCICRRYRPTKLQVHHIHEKAQGGTDDEDNLIVVCMSCHSDVHTRVPFTRRFSQNELKGHRDALVRQVASGVFAGGEDDDDTDRAIRSLLQALAGAAPQRPAFTTQAIELLLHASDPAADLYEGRIMRIRTMGGEHLSAGNKAVYESEKNSRVIASYEHALGVLAAAGLVEERSETLTMLTHEGYLVADEMRAAGPAALTP